MIASITKEFSFEAAHHLPNHDGVCRRPHGHSYKVRVTAVGEVHGRTGISDEGMVIDFKEISGAFKDLIFSRVDHTDLNDLIELTTAERLAEWILKTMRTRLPSVRRVAVSETATSWAEVDAGDLIEY